ncbi:hypothetical protein MHF_0190 [Mycoplasma haemofelis Ohio2]|uniref:Uncharacterized protein n=1 Tax=Mycoplasma haemofelis (strain Ohio2) TaxID=859194 RepID=F6FG23_MYCHI|nr:hypothetical protein MHF_0190 [Mycoplasma haemofelis Ohio2]
MGLKPLIPVVGGVGMAGSAFAAGALGKGKNHENVSIPSSIQKEDTQAPVASRRKLKKFSELQPSLEGRGQCLIFYVSELSEMNDDGSYEYEGYKRTFNSKDEVLSGLAGEGLKQEDLSELLCGSEFGARKYALAKEGDSNWSLVSISS